MINTGFIITLTKFFPQQFRLMQIYKTVSHTLFPCFQESQRIFRPYEISSFILFQVRDWFKTNTTFTTHIKYCFYMYFLTQLAIQQLLNYVKMKRSTLHLSCPWKLFHSCSQTKILLFTIIIITNIF